MHRLFSLLFVSSTLVMMLDADILNVADKAKNRMCHIFDEGNDNSWYLEDLGDIDMELRNSEKHKLVFRGDSFYAEPAGKKGLKAILTPKEDGDFGASFELPSFDIPCSTLQIDFDENGWAIQNRTFDRPELVFCRSSGSVELTPGQSTVYTSC